MSELFSNDNIFINQTVKDQNEAIEKQDKHLYPVVQLQKTTFKL